MTCLTATIGDKVIQSKIQEKEEAKEKYDDAIAGGHAAIIAEKSEKRKDAISLKLGNLLPEKEATINFTVIQYLQIVGGAFSYILPQSYFPDYEKHSTRYGQES